VLVQLYSGRAELEDSDHPVVGLVLRGWNHHATRESVAGGAAAQDSSQHHTESAPQRWSATTSEV
jgi:hypothetical protein